METYIKGAAFGLGNPSVDGFFLDDNWSEQSGPSEEDKDCVEKMGLSPQDVADITAGWRRNTEAAQAAI